MKQHYRELVEQSVEIKKKLAAAHAMKRDAEQALEQADGYVEFNTRCLNECEQKILAIETTTAR